jgi:uncharacterized protein (DUF433 family)
MKRGYHGFDAMGDRITIEPGKRSGQPCIRGLRITVWDVLDWMAAGMNQEQILADYPELELADFPAVFDYASRVGRQSREHGEYRAMPESEEGKATLIGKALEVVVTSVLWSIAVLFMIMGIRGLFSR